MRRWVLGTSVVLALVTGCKDAFRARPEVAAEAGGTELSTDRLASLMAGIKGVPMSREAADFIAGMWVDQTLFAQAVAKGDNLTDSAIATQVLWPELSQLIAERWHDSLLARRAPMTPAVADSIYNAGELRILQHILIKIEPNAEPPARAAGKKRADAVLARVAKGGDFAALAKELSDDPSSKPDGGYLPPAPRGRWVTAFDSAGWTLAPGQRTGLVESPFGYHIIRRPPPAEVQQRFLAFAREQVGNQLDAIYMDSLGARRGLKLSSNAAAAVREAMANRDKSAHSTTALATYTGGALTVGDFVRWVNALGPAMAADLARRPDSSVTRFVQLLAQNELLLKQADSAGIKPMPEEWKQMQAQYAAQVDTLKMSLGLSAADFADPAMPEGDRVRAASVKIESYWDEVAKGGPRPRPIPPQLAAILRDKLGYKLETAGLEQAVTLAKAKKAHNDSTNAKGVAAPTPGVTPGAPPPSLTPPAQAPAAPGAH